MSTESTPVNVVDAYGEWIANCPVEWSHPAYESAHRQLIDTVAVMIPGAIEPSALIALETVRSWGGTDSGANITGTTDKFAAPWAALVNGTAAHALDFDDNFDPPKAHASAVLYPAILALADTHEISGMGGTGRESGSSKSWLACNGDRWCFWRSGGLCPPFETGCRAERTCLVAGQ